METVLMASLFCMDNLLPILLGLGVSALLGYLLRGFLKGGSGGDSDLQTKFDKLSADYNQLSARYDDLNKKSKKIKGSTEASTVLGVAAPNTAEIDSLNAKLKSLRAELKQAQEDNARLKGEVSAAKARAAEANTLNSEVETLKARIEGMNRALDAAKGDIERYKSDFESANSERARLSADLAASDVGALKKQIEKLQNDVQSARMTNAQLQAENDTLKSGGPKSVASGVETKNLSNDVNELKEQLASLRKELNDAKADAERFKRDSDNAKLAINAAVNAANEKSNAEISELRRQLKLAEADAIRARDENTRLAQSAAAKTVEVKQADAPSAPAAEPKVEAAAAPKPDDLKVLEGVGPALEKVLNNGGVYTYAQLASMKPEEVKAILEASGDKLHNPETWPEQAALLRDGKMDEFNALIATLDAGVRVSAEELAERKAKQEAAEALKAAKANPDDLKVLEGVGPVLEKLLNDADIYTYAQLASMTADQLKQILEDAGDKMHNPTSWPQQAALLRDGKMDEFQKLCDELRGGVA